MDAQTLYELILKLREQIRDLCFQHFLRYEFLSAVWWVLIALIIIPLFVWWKLVDKRRLVEISMFGLLLGLCATFLDVVGTDYMLWYYPVHVIPEAAVLIPVDFVVLPVIQMFIYQKWPKWGKYLLASLVSAALQAFVAEPLAILIGQYELLNWSIFYSFPIYIALDVAVKFVVECFKKVQAKANMPEGGKHPEQQAAREVQPHAEKGRTGLK